MKLGDTPHACCCAHSLSYFKKLNLFTHSFTHSTRIDSWTHSLSVQRSSLCVRVQWLEKAAIKERGGRYSPALLERLKGKKLLQWAVTHPTNIISANFLAGAHKVPMTLLPARTHARTPLCVAANLRQRYWAF